MARASEARVFRALLRRSFLAFVRKVFGTLEPGQAYVPNWHLEAIAYQLERVLRGEIRRLIVNMPPRSLKSLTVSIAFPAFALGHDPSRRLSVSRTLAIWPRNWRTTSARSLKLAGTERCFPTHGSGEKTQRPKSS